MTHDFTYLNQLPVQDLIDRAARGNWTGPEAHMIRALVDRLEEHIDAAAEYDRLNDELIDANQRAESWREEAQAVQRQLDRVRG
jgi:uncharacterized protein YlxW (UPF0749 family)